MGEKAETQTRTPGLNKRKPVSKAHKTVAHQSILLPSELILHLHKTIGNHAVQRLFASGVIQSGSCITSSRNNKRTVVLDLPSGLHSSVCSPTGTDVKGVQDFALEKVGENPPAGSFGAGFTSPKVEYSPTDLEVSTVRKDKAVTCKPKAVTPTLTTDSRFVKPGAHQIPDMTAEVPPEVCKKKGKALSLPVYVSVSKEISDLARKAEEEHCDDFGYAFAQTVGKWAAEVNKLVKSGKSYGPDKTEEDCKKSVGKDLTKSLDERLKEFAALAPKTDTRDQKGYHSFSLDTSTVSVEDKCSKIVLPVVKTSTLKIGKISSGEIMK